MQGKYRFAKITRLWFLFQKKFWGFAFKWTFSMHVSALLNCVDFQNDGLGAILRKKKILFLGRRHRVIFHNLEFDEKWNRHFIPFLPIHQFLWCFLRGKLCWLSEHRPWCHLKKKRPFFGRRHRIISHNLEFDEKWNRHFISFYPIYQFLWCILRGELCWLSKHRPWCIA